MKVISGERVERLGTHGPRTDRHIFGDLRRES